MLISIDNESKIPLFGLDFIGILDRGTNLLEIKPITYCNIKCKIPMNKRCKNSSGDEKWQMCYVFKIKVLN